MVLYCGHAYAFKDHKFAECCMQESLSWYKACIRVATGNYEKEEEGTGNNTHSNLRKEAHGSRALPGGAEATA